jgi:hypothetical protein
MTSCINANCADRRSRSCEISFQTLGFPYLGPTAMTLPAVLVVTATGALRLVMRIENFMATNPSSEWQSHCDPLIRPIWVFTPFIATP